MIQTVEIFYIRNSDDTANIQGGYKITWSDTDNKSFVPLNANENRHYQEILEWVAAGNTITDPGA
jgi:hypothetical protein